MVIAELCWSGGIHGEVIRMVLTRKITASHPVVFFRLGVLLFFNMLPILLRSKMPVVQKLARRPGAEPSPQSRSPAILLRKCCCLPAAWLSERDEEGEVRGGCAHHHIIVAYYYCSRHGCASTTRSAAAQLLVR